jgi:hypothetical protein
MIKMLYAIHRPSNKVLCRVTPVRSREEARRRFGRCAVFTREHTAKRQAAEWNRIHLDQD